MNSPGGFASTMIWQGNRPTLFGSRKRCLDDQPRHLRATAFARDCRPSYLIAAVSDKSSMARLVCSTRQPVRAPLLQTCEQGGGTPSSRSRPPQPRFSRDPRRYRSSAISIRRCRASTARSNSHARSRRAGLVSCKSRPQAAANALLGFVQAHGGPASPFRHRHGNILIPHFQAPSSSRIRPIVCPSYRRT